ncbi:Uncharacterized conserved secreted protein [Marinomonas sp. MED121]|uniref:DUF6279 family lipoprotein n=1 Tax=Marinomonas sp. MED121 TaxID=314277 RepID=UPI0000690D51|nr:DUF6279 family lipoprotein [Marinomonas sp. MED121]EAQ65188.1 Uncharacterized conserved secreted protein [Marinomonas sp. MED121]
MKVFLIIFISVILTACSLGSTAYKHFDYVVLWYAADYVRLEKKQKAALSAATNSFIQWHRGSELPKYQRLFNEFKQDIKQQTISPTKADYYRQEVRQFWKNIRDYIEPNLAPLLATLSDKQYQQITKNLTHQINEKSSNAKTLKERLSKMKERTEDWYGSLNEEQVQILTQINTKRSAQRPLWHAENRAWLKAFKTASMLPQEERTESIKSILLQTMEPSTKNNYSEKEDWYRIWQYADEQQIAAILKKLSEYEEILDDISNQ